MAFAAAAITSTTDGPLNKAWSLGPVKVQKFTFGAITADVSGSFTATALNSIDHVEISGLVLTALPTIAGNVVTLSFINPGATVAGTISCYGR